MRPKYSKYLWLYISDKDIALFNSAFSKTPDLHCNDSEHPLICPAGIDNWHNHSNIWKLTDKDIMFVHKTNYGPFYTTVNWKKISIDNEFADYLVNLTFEAHNLAKKIKNEGLYGEVKEGGVKTTIYSLVMKWSNSLKLTLLDIVSDLLLAFSCRHKFLNGNKRTALILSVLFLKFCGLFLENTHLKEENYLKFWEEFMISIVEAFSIERVDEFTLQKRIKEIIDNCISISYTIYTTD